MLQVVAEESEVEVIIGQHVRKVEPARANEVHILGQGARDVAYVRRPAIGGANVADEVAEVASDVDHARAWLDKALQVPAHLAPDGLLGDLVLATEPLLVDLFENDRRQLAGGPYPVGVRFLPQSLERRGHWKVNDSARSSGRLSGR